ncbi:uncharacterized protein LODBEIA_P32060 [Lodderomyces beijingensis]|uniref:RNA helicase n=1 Tax=Lodderomyces beijingensis TaxID=1775926 RepID=A0ABP0ZLF6_9ASCO
MSSGSQFGRVTNNPRDNDEKQRLRREKLAALREKKQQQEQKQKEQQQQQPEQKQENGNLAGKSKTAEESLRLKDLEEKQRQRQQRLEEWKKSRSKKEEGSVAGDGKRQKAGIALAKKPLSSKPKVALSKKRVSDFDVETEVVRKKAPKLLQQSNLGEAANNVLHKEPSNHDELDDYMNSIFRANDVDGTDNNDATVQVADKRPGADGDSHPEPNNDNNDPDYNNEDNYDDDDEEEEEEEEDTDRLLMLKLTKLQNTGKQLQEVDHKSIDYQPFTKNFYQVPFDIKDMSHREIDMLRMELDNVRVRGKETPAPFTRWSQLLLPNNIMSVVNERLEFKKPSPIQSQAIPVILSGRDLIGVAKTGSGKTLAYVLPMMRHVQDQTSPNPGDGPIALILAPTRELALQIEQEVSKFATANSELRVCCCYGGSSIETQISELKRGVHVVVATPGRLIDLLAANGGRVLTLRRTTFLVLDEADRMFDMGFEPQIRKICSQIRPDRQTVLISATFPKKLEMLAKKVLENPVEVVVGGIGVVASGITQEVVLCNDNRDEIRDKNKEAEPELDIRSVKLNTLKSILSRHELNGNNKLLIFVEKQIDADTLVLNLLKNKIPCVAIHGGKNQMDRAHAIKEFSDRESGVDILVATSIAARGLDVKNLSLVINFDPPGHLEDYVHRVGRTGRAGAMGRAITFVTKSQEKEISILVKALKMSSNPVDPSLQEIADRFAKKIESGEERKGFGFGGKGLDKLQKVRDNNMQMQRKMFGGAKEEVENKNSREATNEPDEAISSMVLPTFEIFEGNSPETSGPDTCKFFCRITINDMPQKVRWSIVQGETLASIVDSTKTSITTRGQFYSPQSAEQPTSEKPKLYLLVEGLTRKSVENAIALIKDKMLQSVESMSLEDSNRSAATGRYKV